MEKGDKSSTTGSKIVDIPVILIFVTYTINHGHHLQ